MLLIKIQLWLLFTTSILEGAFSRPISAPSRNYTLLLHLKQDVDRKLNRRGPISPHSSAPSSPSRPTSQQQGHTPRLTGSVSHQASEEIPPLATMTDVRTALGRLYPPPRRYEKGSDNWKYLAYNKYHSQAVRAIERNVWSKEQKEQWFKEAREESKGPMAPTNRNRPTSRRRRPIKVYKVGEFRPTRETIDQTPLMNLDDVGKFLSMVFDNQVRTGKRINKEGTTRSHLQERARVEMERGLWTIENQRNWMRDAYKRKDSLRSAQNFPSEHSNPTIENPPPAIQAGPSEPRPPQHQPDNTDAESPGGNWDLYEPPSGPNSPQHNLITEDLNMPIQGTHGEPSNTPAQGGPSSTPAQGGPSSTPAQGGPSSTPAQGGPSNIPAQTIDQVERSMNAAGFIRTNTPGVSGPTWLGPNQEFYFIVGGEVRMIYRGETTVIGRLG